MKKFWVALAFLGIATSSAQAVELDLLHDDSLCANPEAVILQPVNTKNRLIYALVQKLAPNTRFAICVEISEVYPVAHAYTLIKPRRAQGLRVILFEARFFKAASYEVLEGVVAHELAHGLGKEITSCERPLSRKMYRAYARCELAVDRIAARSVGECTVRDFLRYMAYFERTRYPEYSYPGTDIRLGWFEKHANCSDDQ